MSKLTRVQEYFNQEAQDYGAYFKSAERPKSIGRYLAKHIFSPKAPQQRMNAVIELCKPNIGSKKILEIGCGTGQYVIALAHLGANVTGIDFAPNMIKIAQQLAVNEGVDKRCNFIATDILEYEPDEVFDVSFAAGVLDYISPDLRIPVLLKMKRLSRQGIIISFPKKWHWHAFLRKIWLTLKNVPVYFYSQSDINRLFAKAGFREKKSLDIGILTVKKAVPTA